MAKYSKTNQDGKKGEWLFLLVFFILSVTSAVFGVLCISRISAEWVQKNYLLFCSLYGLMIILLYALFVLFLLLDKKTVTRLFFGGFILLTTCLLLAYILQ